MNTNPNQQGQHESADIGGAEGGSRPDDPAVVAAAAGKVTPEQSTRSGRHHQPSHQHNRAPPSGDDDDLAGDLLVGAEKIEAHLKRLGVPDPDAYYLRRSRKWPIGKYGANLIASRRRLNNHAEKITRGNTAA